MEESRVVPGVAAAYRLTGTDAEPEDCVRVEEEVFGRVVRTPHSLHDNAVVTGLSRG